MIAKTRFGFTIESARNITEQYALQAKTPEQKELVARYMHDNDVCCADAQVAVLGVQRNTTFAPNPESMFRK